MWMHIIDVGNVTLMYAILVMQVGKPKCFTIGLRLTLADFQSTKSTGFV